MPDDKTFEVRVAPITVTARDEAMAKSDVLDDIEEMAADGVLEIESVILSGTAEKMRPVYRWEGINPPEGIDDWIETAPAQWDDIAEAMREVRVESINEARRSAEYASVMFARLAAYLNERCRPSSDGDAGHAKALKAQNAMAAKVRRALGYCQARDDMSF